MVRNLGGAGRMSRRIICFVAAIIALGLALRLIGIERQPLWGDEGLTLLTAQFPMVALFLAPIDPTPGLYYKLLSKSVVRSVVGLVNHEQRRPV